MNRERVFKENQDFWEGNNQHFLDEKEKFIKGFPLFSLLFGWLEA